MTKHIIHTLSELQKLSFDIVANLSTATEQATIIALRGELGVGKTTLTQMIGAQLGIDCPMSSPTFVIAKYYDLQKQSWNRLIHIDAYRLQNEPTESIDFTNLFSDPANIIVVEWPQYIISLIPTSTVVDITIRDDDARIVHITTN